PVFSLPIVSRHSAKGFSKPLSPKTNTVTLLMPGIATFQETFAITGGSHTRNVAGSTTKLTPDTDCVEGRLFKLSKMNNVIENERTTTAMPPRISKTIRRRDHIRDLKPVQFASKRNYLDAMRQQCF